LVQRLNPDVSGLLPLLDEFIRVLAADGTTEKALWVKRQMMEERFRQLESEGSARQLYAAGIYLLEGAGYRQDIDRGAFFIRQAAQKNHTPAQVQLARLYRDGRGLPKDFGKAYLWLTIAGTTLKGDEKKEAMAQCRMLEKKIDAARLPQLQSEALHWTPAP